MSKELKLTIELVPKTCWYSNVRSNLSRVEWDLIRTRCYEQANHFCEICDDSGSKQSQKHNLECHEIWQYDDANRIQKLVGLIALCPNCHTVKHAGLAKIQNKSHIVISQLMKVNNMTKLEAVNYIESAFKIWQERSKYTDWKLDISYLKTWDSSSVKTVGV